MSAEINRGYLNYIRRWSRPSTFSALRVVKQAMQVVLVPFVLVLALVMLASLRVVVARRKALSPLHRDAAAHVADFVTQYPFHLYPIVAKSLELAYVRRRLASLTDDRSAIVEVAIGEGTLSARVFEASRRVTGLDLNPFSLVRAATLSHVTRAVVGDGLHPPLRAGAFDLLLSLNLLHHVTAKRETVASWVPIARTVLFNENTWYWATGWTPPYVLRRLGLSSLADRFARRIERRQLQRLISQRALDDEIRAVTTVREEVSFLSERTFFLCGLFSFLMLCYGPPTPPILKSIFLGPLRAIAIPLTTAIAARLLEFDSAEPRTTDTFVFYECEGATGAASSTNSDLLCPRCGASVVTGRCSGCGTVYPVSDGMLFLLPPDLMHIYDEYVHRRAAPMPAEHL